MESFRERHPAWRRGRPRYRETEVVRLFSVRFAWGCGCSSGAWPGMARRVPLYVPKLAGTVGIVQDGKHCATIPSRFTGIRVSKGTLCSQSRERNPSSSTSVRRRPTGRRAAAVLSRPHAAAMTSIAAETTRAPVQGRGRNAAKTRRRAAKTLHRHCPPTPLKIDERRASLPGGRAPNLLRGIY